jgi:hypothetical protein
MKKHHGNKIFKVCSKYFICIDDLLAHTDEKHKDTPNLIQSHFEHDTKDAANDQSKEIKRVKKWLPKHSNVFIEVSV